MHRSLVYKMRPERISVLSESLPSLSSLYDDNCDARDVMLLMIVMTIINMMTMMTVEDGGNDRNDHHNDDDNQTIPPNTLLSTS